MEVTYYTDGGCEPNPGNGCWAFICTNPYQEAKGSEPNTTSNRMEMTAVLKAIEHGLEMKAKPITIYSDSQYVVKGFNEWMWNWAKKGWDRDRELKNVDLWKRLFKYRRKATLIWIKGHNGNEYNEQADDLVRTEYEATFGGQMRF